MTGWNGWAALKGELSGGTPAVGRNADGRLEVFAEAPGATGPELAHVWQDPASATGWSSWASLGAPPAQFLGFPAVGSNADGRLEAFARVGLMSTGGLWHIWQTAPNNGWSTWDNLGGGIGGHFLRLVTNADGRLEVFAINTLGRLEHIWQTTPGGGWSAWDELGTPAGVSLFAAAVGRNADGRLDAFASAATARSGISRKPLPVAAGVAGVAWVLLPGLTWPYRASVKTRMAGSKCWRSATSARCGTSGSQRPMAAGVAGPHLAHRPASHKSVSPPSLGTLMADWRSLRPN